MFFRLFYDWPLWARLKQRPPPGNWHCWLLLGGRGAGKTRTGAEWLKGIVEGNDHFPGNACGRVALVAKNYADARDVMVEGSSGLLSLYAKSERPVWRATRRELQWSNGTIWQLFSSTDPEGLRGNQFGAAWCDAKTIWGALLAVGATFSGSLGFMLEPAIQTDLADTFVRLAGAIGALFAIYGRLTATDVIS